MLFATLAHQLLSVRSHFHSSISSLSSCTDPLAEQTRQQCLSATALTHDSHPHPGHHVGDESCAEFTFAGPLAFPPPSARRNPAAPSCLLVCRWFASTRHGSKRPHAQAAQAGSWPPCRVFIYAKSQSATHIALARNTLFVGILPRGALLWIHRQ